VDSGAARDRITLEGVYGNALVMFDAGFLGRGSYARKRQDHESYD
jgi:hypothetical protein